MRSLLLTLAVAATVVPRESPETLAMAALLKQRIAAVDPVKMPFLLNERRAALLGEELEWPRPMAERLPLRYNLAAELLNAGRVHESLAALDALEADAKQSPETFRSMPSAVPLLRGLAHLRQGEEENCHQGNTRDSCLWPIRGEGIHVRREGSTRAAEVFARILETDPGNLQARWLLNVAHMTLGSYPEGVPAAQLIGPERFASDYPLPRFPNVAREAGLDIHAVAGGAVLDDLDNDGLLDLLVSSMGLEDPLRFFHNRGDGGFDERSAAQLGLTGIVGGLNLVQADYDNDGFLDVLVLRGGWMRSEGRFPLSLLRNRGDGTFTDVTRAAGLLRFAPSQTATWFDYDGDGWLDLFVGNESAPLATRDAALVHRSELFHNNRDGSFTNVSQAAGVDVVAYVKGVASGDYDNDGRPDLYVSTQGGENFLFHNDGPSTDGASWRFTNVAAAAGVGEPKDSFGTFFFDYDNDGRLDLFVVGYGWTTAADVAADYLGLPTPVERGRLYRNRGDGSFAEVTREAGLYRVVPGMGHNFGDLDNDGFLDIYLGTGTPELATLVPNRMFRNDGGRRFQDVTSAGNFGHLQKGHAVCFGDIDNDGDQDVFEQMGGAQASDTAYSALYENPGNANRWLGLQLEGVRSNRAAIGARIKVDVDGPGGARSIYRTVNSGGSFGGSPLRQQIGLGDANRIASVEVSWPATGETQRVSGVELDRRYRVREGVAGVVGLDIARSRLGVARHPAQRP